MIGLLQNSWQAFTGLCVNDAFEIKKPVTCIIGGSKISTKIKNNKKFNT